WRTSRHGRAVPRCRREQHRDAADRIDLQHDQVSRFLELDIRDRVGAPDAHGFRGGGWGGGGGACNRRRPGIAGRLHEQCDRYKCWVHDPSSSSLHRKVQSGKVPLRALYSAPSFSGAPMGTGIQQPTSQSAGNPFTDVFKVLYEPGEVFERVRVQPRFLAPFATIIAVQCLLFFINLSYLKIAIQAQMATAAPGRPVPSTGVLIAFGVVFTVIIIGLLLLISALILYVGSSV